MSDFWEQLEEGSAQLIRLNVVRGALDVERRERDRSCLGGALGLEADAIRLAITGYEDVARSYFDTVHVLASRALSTGETYTFGGMDGGASFARYACYRMLANVEWLRFGSMRTESAAQMMSTLERCLALEADVRSNSVVVGHLYLHSAQVENWDLVNRIGILRSALGLKGEWGRLVGFLVEFYRKASSRGGDRERLVSRFDEWFRVKVLRVTDLSFVSQEFATADALAIAQVRAREIAGTVDPWLTVRTLRWPDLGM